MADFKHVSDERLRSILMQDAVGEDDICYALTTTRKAIEADKHDEDVPYDVLDARRTAIETAEAWWNEEAQVERSIESLRTCWSV